MRPERLNWDILPPSPYNREAPVTRRLLLIDGGDNVVRDLVILLIDETGLAVANSDPTDWKLAGPSSLRVRGIEQHVPGWTRPESGAQYYIHCDAAGRGSH